MKKFTLLLIILFTTMGSLLAQTATAPAGSGTIGSPYQVATLNNLYWISQNSAQWNKYFIQTADIDAAASSSWNAGAGFNQIGNTTTAFTGSYDGQGHTISNLFISRSGTTYIGLFGWVNPPAVIKQLGVINANIAAGTVCGALIGYISGSGTVIVQRCYSSGTVSGTYACGGLIGCADIGTISQCYSSATVSIPSGTSEVGGFIGENRASISNCYARGNVSSTPAFTGGGGFAGANYGGVITNCFSTGTVTGTGSKGGLVGTNALSGTAPGSFWDTQTSSQATSPIGTGKTTAQMKASATFTGAGWDFAGETINGINDYWSIDGITNNGYASLQYFILLPVTWVSFTVQKQADAALLQWQTATEQNTRDFLVQRSNNGTDWVVIGTVAAKGNTSSLSAYTFTDNAPAKGNNYYRLAERNAEGKSNLSAVVNLNFKQGISSISVYPNPVVSGKVNLQFNNRPAGSYNVSIFTPSGEVVYHAVIKHDGSNAARALQLPASLGKNMYSLKVQEADGSSTLLKIAVLN